MGCNGGDVNVMQWSVLMQLWRHVMKDCSRRSSGLNLYTRIKLLLLFIIIIILLLLLLLYA